MYMYNAFGGFGVLFALAKLSFLEQNLGQKTSLYHTQKI